jgi:hypothetical protein
MRIDLVMRSDTMSLSVESSGSRSDVWLGVGARNTWGSAEVLLGLSVLGSSQEESIGSSWSSHNQLIKSEAFTTGLHDLGSSTFGESESSNSHLWYFKASSVISHSANSDDNFICSFKKLSTFGDRDWWSVNSGRDESSQNCLSECRVGSSGEESEQFDKKMNIEISASSVLLVRVLNSTSFDEINTL